jgi:glycosyltransferase involved in cell wall biosynthesis
VLRLVERQRLEAAVDVPGFVAAPRVHAAISSAVCLILPSRREGYGLVVVEAAASGTPSVVVEGPDNAAVELVEDGVNGFVAASASPDDLGAAIVRAYEGGSRLRRSTIAWFESKKDELSLERSLDTVRDAYGRR